MNGPHATALRETGCENCASASPASPPRICGREGDEIARFRVFGHVREYFGEFSPRWAFCAAAGLTAIAAALAVLYYYDPETAGFYPICAFHQLTGLQCPGCGSLRALHQLTHGNFAAAWRFNPLLIASLPLAIWIGLREAARLIFGWRRPGVITRPWVGWALLIVTLVFGVARNLP